MQLSDLVKSYIIIIVVILGVIASVVLIGVVRKYKIDTENEFSALSKKYGLEYKSYEWHWLTTKNNIIRGNYLGHNIEAYIKTSAFDPANNGYWDNFVIKKDGIIVLNERIIKNYPDGLDAKIMLEKINSVI